MKREAIKALRRWVGIFAMQRYEITLEVQEKGHLLGECHGSTENLTATIRLFENTIREEDDGDPSDTVMHELLHMLVMEYRAVFEPIPEALQSVESTAHEQLVRTLERAFKKVEAGA